jgi:hypothetical protein
MDFPGSPAVNDTYSFEGRTWRYDGEGWRRVINASQIVSVFTLLYPINEDTVTSLPYPIDGSWSLVNYV